MQLFISYSRDDTAFAKQLVEDLSDYDVKIWLDVLSIPKGANWDNEVQKGLDTSDIMLVLLSPGSVRSQNVADEWSYFIEKGKTIVPIMIAECDVPFRLSRRQRVNFLGDYRAGFEELIRSLGSPRLIDPDSTARINPPVRPGAPASPGVATSSAASRPPATNTPLSTARPGAQIAGELDVAVRVLPVIWAADYHWLNGLRGGDVGEAVINNREINLVPHMRPVITIPLSSLISVKMQRAFDPYLKVTYYGTDSVFQSMALMGASRERRIEINTEVLNLLKLLTKRSLE